MNGLLAVLALAGPLSLIVASLVIALLSQRLGMITKQVRAYRWLFVGIGVMVVGIITAMRAPYLYGMVYPLTMACGLTIVLGAALYYWGWLFSEREYHQHSINASPVDKGTSR